MPQTDRKFKVMGTITMNFETYITAEDDDAAWEKAEELAREEALDMEFDIPVDTAEIGSVEEIK